MNPNAGGRLGKGMQDRPRRGRPPLAADVARGHRIVSFVTLAEKAAVVAMAQARGLSMSEKQIEHVVRNVLCHDVDEVGIQLVLERGISPEPPALTFERIYRANMPAVPCTYLKLLQDRTLAVETQEQMIANLGQTNVLSLDTGHTAMLSQPQELAGILNQIAEQTKVRSPDE